MHELRRLVNASAEGAPGRRFVNASAEGRFRPKLNENRSRNASAEFRGNLALAKKINSYALRGTASDTKVAFLLAWFTR